MRLGAFGFVRVSPVAPFSARRPQIPTDVRTDEEWIVFRLLMSCVIDPWFCIAEVSISFVKCSVDGCSRKLQPILKVDPRDRDTWFYRECDVCLKPACEKHSTEAAGQVICDRCLRGAELQPPSNELIDLGIRVRPEPC
jgi:hypothetical protein